VLTGTQRGVFGTLPLEPAFLEAMAAASSTPGAVQAAAPA